MSKFKIGDMVRCIQPPATRPDNNEPGKGGHGWEMGKEFTIATTTIAPGEYVVLWAKGSPSGVYEDSVELVTVSMNKDDYCLTF